MLCDDHREKQRHLRPIIVSVCVSAGVMGLVWSVLWWFLVYDTPAKHPRISIEEREYIEKALATRKGAKVYLLEF